MNADDDRDEVRTVADLLAELGGIGPDRVIMTPPPGTATEADVIALARAPRKRLCELIDGTLVDKAVGFRESVVGAYLGCDLFRAAALASAGIVLGAGAAVRLWPGRVRIPDGAYYSWDRLPGRRIPDEPIPEIAPDLAFDVIKTGNTAPELDRKRSDYFRAGVRLAWQIDVRARTVAVYTSPASPIELRGADVLDAAPVLPHFRRPLAELFAILDRHC
jgi:Uma2 family endonuclease